MCKIFHSCHNICNKNTFLISFSQPSKLYFSNNLFGQKCCLTPSEIRQKNKYKFVITGASFHLSIKILNHGHFFMLNQTLIMLPLNAIVIPDTNFLHILIKNFNISINVIFISHSLILFRSFD